MLVMFALCSPIGADPGEPLWRFVTGGRIRSFPAVGWDGSVYVLSDDRFLYALTPSGEQRWRYYLEERLGDCFAVGYDGMVYVGYKSGEVVAVHGYGRKVWRYDTAQPLTLSPAVRSDGGICLAADRGTLFVINHTGTLLWKRTLPAPPASAPVADADNMLFVGLKNGELAALEPWGDMKWRLKLAGTPVAPAIDGDGRIYVGTSAGFLYAIDPLVPKIVWRLTLGGVVFTPVIGAGETLYAASSTGKVTSIDRSGRTLWTARLGESPSGPCALGSGGTIFAATRGSSLFALDGSGKVKWKVGVKGILTQLTLSPQAKLYAGSSDWAVYAFPAEKPAAAAWPVSRHDASHTGASSRSFESLSMEERYANDPDFIYFQSLFLSGDAELMQKGLDEIRSLHGGAGGIKAQKVYLLYFLRRMAGFTVIEEEKTMKFPLRGYSEIRRQACTLYTELAGLGAYPLMLKILTSDRDARMKAVAAYCLGRLKSDPTGEAVAAMARLIRTAGARPDDTFAREAVIAMENIVRYRGRLPREGVQALLAISDGPYSAAVRRLAGDALAALGRKN